MQQYTPEGIAALAVTEDERPLRMGTVDLTQESFEQTVTDNEIVLVDWWASWCGPCRMFAPVYDAASEKNPDVVFGKVDTEAEQELAGAARISSIPTLMAFRDGIMVFSQPGALPAQGLDQVIQAVRGLDMEEIRTQYAEKLAELDRQQERDVDSATFAEKIARPGVVVLDVRTPAEYADGHLPGAVLMDIQGSDFAARMKELDPSAEYAVYCRSGNRSGQALRIFEANGLTSVYHLAGGVLDWSQSGRALITS